MNDEVAHGIPSESRILKEGDLINIDISAEFGGYYSDTGISFVLGKGDEMLHKLCQSAESAFKGLCRRARQETKPNRQSRIQ
ncbi:M24 family metallopeptidase [Bacillus licheniformis]|nr:M24 family metallopeptidase [Bacillus licheniformis]